MPPTFWTFSTAAGFAYTAYAMCRTPTLALYASHLGAGPELIGLVAAASTLAGVALKFPAGALSDAIGRRTVLIVAGGLYALMPLAYPLVASLALLFVVRLVHGTASALFGPTASAALSDIAPREARGRWLGTYSAIQGSGQAAGPVIAGVILAASGFTATFLTAAAIGFIAWLLVTLSAPRPTSATRVPIRGITAAARAVATDRRIVLTSLAQASQFVLHGVLGAFLPIYAVQRGLAPREVGLLFGIQMAITILSRPLFGRLSDRAGRVPMIVLGIALSAAAVAGLSQTASFLPMLSVAAIYGVGLAITTTSTGALITDLVDRSRYGAAHGLFGTIFDVGDALGPIAAGLLVAQIGFERTFQVVGLAVFGFALMFGASARRWKTS